MHQGVDEPDARGEEEVLEEEEDDEGDDDEAGMEGEESRGAETTDQLPFINGKKVIETRVEDRFGNEWGEKDIPTSLSYPTFSYPRF